MAEQIKKNRLLLLQVFHGGLIAYLMLHEVLIPMINNLAKSRAFLTDMNAWFVPHIAMLLCYSNESIRHFTYVLFWFLVYALSLCFAPSLIQLLSEGVKSVGLTIFIEYLSQLIFLSIFWGSFRHELSWSSFRSIPAHAICLVLAAGLFGFKSFFLQVLSAPRAVVF